MFRRASPAVAAFALAMAAATSTPARAEDAPPITPLSVDVKRYDSIIDHRKEPGLLCCAPLRLTNPEGDFVHLSIVFDVAWSEEFKQLRVGGRDIGLKLPGVEEPLRPFGSFERKEMLSSSTPSIFERRPGKWPDEDANAHYNAVWLVPRDAKTGTIVIKDTDFAMDVSLEAPTSEPVDPKSLIEATIDALTPLDRVATEYKNGKIVTQGVIEPSTGKIIAVDATIAINGPNATDGKSEFFIQPAMQLALTGPDGAPLPFLGLIANDTYLGSYSYSSRWTGDRPKKPFKMRLLYAGSAAPGTYTLHFMTQPVATASLAQ